MATIKSHTDLQQSRKLAEILPLESADMYYWCADHYPKEDWVIEVGAPDNNYECICAWSLAALLSVLPRFIKFKGDKYYLRFMKDYVEYANDEVSITGRCLHTTGNDNLVDACYEMILNLKEKNLLRLWK